jgi:hypothetical protein
MAADEYRVEIDIHESVHGHLTERQADVRRRRWNPNERFWQDADEPLAEADSDTPPDPAKTATNKDLQHPFFVFVEAHQPEFLRDLGP